MRGGTFSDLGSWKLGTWEAVGDTEGELQQLLPRRLFTAFFQRALEAVESFRICLPECQRRRKTAGKWKVERGEQRIESQEL